MGMVLVDKDIKNLVKENRLIVEGYDEANVGSISCDLTIDTIISFTTNGPKEQVNYELASGEYCVIQTKEKISMPDNLIGRIEEKNSIIRLGLIVSGPCYQPGHETYCYLRVYNISKQRIILSKGFKIAQIMFEELSGVPNETYNQKSDASFNQEEQYRGFAKYREDYKTRVV